MTLKYTKKAEVKAWEQMVEKTKAKASAKQEG
jgi:hypothetical protein